MGTKVTRRQLVVAAGAGAAGLYVLGGPLGAIARAARPAGGRSRLRYYYTVRRCRPRTIETDVCVYGGTSAGIAAAVQARRLGRTRAGRRAGAHLGGMTAGGLGVTDIGNKRRHRRPRARVLPPRSASTTAQPETFRFEPHVAERGLRASWSPSRRSPVYREQRLAVGAARTATGSSSAAWRAARASARAMFIDATYEGDLMARPASPTRRPRGATRPTARRSTASSSRAGAPVPRAASIRTSRPATRRAACCRASTPTRRARRATATTASRRTTSACA